MSTDFLTKPIVISANQSKEFINSLRKPDKEYMKKRDEIFGDIDSRITIHCIGQDMKVEIDGLDLSFINDTPCNNKNI